MRILALLFVVVTTIWLVRANEARQMPELEIWHKYSLQNEYHAVDYPHGITFSEYQQLETRLDEELDEEIYRRIGVKAHGQFSRYDKTSLTYAGENGQKWNRSFERAPKSPVGGILLLHGASDSPYSVRKLSQLFEKQGFYVLALRLPGNGTIPSGLKRAKLDDWLSITRMGVMHVKEKVGPDAPLYLGGYSVGGGLVLDYTLDALSDTSLAIPDRLFLYSPAIGITKFARFSAWDIALSAIPYFEKFSWVSIQPEFDPYKYNSFAKKAGHITYLLTERIRRKMVTHRNSPSWQSLPPMISFQSLVDSTVHTGALVSELYQYLPENGSELILFDTNRANDLQHFMIDKERATLDQLLADQSTSFGFTLVTNKAGDSIEVEARTRVAGEKAFLATDLHSSWPTGVYSLSHVAIPFDAGDPWYGAEIKSDGAQNFSIGTVAPRGEQGLLTVPSAQFMRLRHNPFFDYVAQRTNRFCTVCRPQ